MKTLLDECFREGWLGAVDCLGNVGHGGRRRRQRSSAEGEPTESGRSGLSLDVGVSRAPARTASRAEVGNESSAWGENVLPWGTEEKRVRGQATKAVTCLYGEWARRQWREGRMTQAGAKGAPSCFSGDRADGLKTARPGPREDEGGYPVYKDAAFPLGRRKRGRPRAALKTRSVLAVHAAPRESTRDFERGIFSLLSNVADHESII